jgi:DnaJ-class molecular chaperone
MSNEGDLERRRESLALVEKYPSVWKLCAHCGGTGNEFYAMYRECPECRGRGVVENREPVVSEDVAQDV